MNDARAGLPGRALIALSLAAMLAPFGSTMLAVALPVIGHDVREDPADLTRWLVTTYLFVNIVAQGPAGKLVDLFGPSRALAVGRGLYLVGAAAGALAPGLPVLVVARMLMAAGSSLIVPAVMSVLRRGVPEQRRARAFGMNGAVMALAAALGPVLGGEIAARLGWRAIFGATGVPLVLSILLLGPSVFHADVRSTPRPRFDVLGSVLLGSALVALIAGLGSQGANPALVAFGAIALPLFFAWERRVEDPIVDTTLWRRRAFSAANAVIALHNLAMYGLLFEIPYFFSDARGAGTDAIGRAMAALTLTMVAGSPLGARLSERVGARWAAFAGSLVSLVGIGAMTLRLSRFDSPLDAVPALVLIGAGLGLSTAGVQASAMSAVEAQKSGMAAGVLSITRYIGGVAGVAVLGMTLAHQHVDAVIASHRTALLVFAGALGAAALCALGLLRRERGRETRSSAAPR